jgi:twitching motility two-component system response regulator PilH
VSRRILICDDTATDRANLARIVRSAGHEVFFATSGLEAIQQARAIAPALIFMDVNMEGMDGFAAVRSLQKDPRTLKIPVVMVTSKGQKADLVWAKMLGAKGYVVKPYADDAILDQLVAQLAAATA